MSTDELGDIQLRDRRIRASNHVTVRFLMDFIEENHERLSHAAARWTPDYGWIDPLDYPPIGFDD